MAAFYQTLANLKAWRIEERENERGRRVKKRTEGVKESRERSFHLEMTKGKGEDKVLFLTRSTCDFLCARVLEFSFPRQEKKTPQRKIHGEGEKDFPAVCVFLEISEEKRKGK